MDIIQKIKNYVESEYKKPTSKYGYESFPCHLIPMTSCAEKLANELGGDKEIILIAAWLHDIGSIIYGRKDHHLTGAEITEKKLKELHYPQNKIEQVKECILNHRGSRQDERKSLEEQIVTEADAMSNFDNIAGIFKAAYIYENLSQLEAKEEVRKKLENKWQQLQFEKSKEIIRPKYEAAMILLK